MFNVLLVDDSEEFRDAVAEALQRQGYLVTCAANGRQALGILERQRPDIIVLDLIMPEVNGLALLREIRLRPKLAELPVIVLTATMEDRRLMEVKALGAHCLIKGCITLKELSRIVTEHLKAQTSLISR